MNATTDVGKLILIPTPLGDDGLPALPETTLAEARRLRVFIVERLRTARRFLRAAGSTADFDNECTFYELDKRTQERDLPGFLVKALKEGRDIGLLSEAGAPAVADPGARVVRLAHRHGMRVVPLVGPSSLLLALMSSGMNGQTFAFKGYLSPKRQELGRDLLQLERDSADRSETQLWIEAPYRNRANYGTALEVLQPGTLFGIATDLTLSTEYTRTLPVEQWRKEKVPDLHKRPTIFLLFVEK